MAEQQLNEAALVLKWLEPGASKAFQLLSIHPAIAKFEIAISISIAISLRRLADRLDASSV